MRSKLASTILGFAVAAGASACAKPAEIAMCHPVSSWVSPVFECAAPAPPPAPPPPPPAPEPVAAPEPPPPPPKAVMKEDKIELAETIEFETDSDVIKDHSTDILDQITAILKEHTEVTKVELQGYTDSQGNKAHNQKLSKARAESTKKYLVDHGIDAKRMTTKGFGQDNPVGDNKTEEGRHQNRRVDFKIVEKKKTDS
jgi:outer membrane protein OmpA-like peptidoglycan-associated protein